MRLFYLSLVSCLGLLVSSAAIAGQIYQCEQDGRKVFSQEPCGDDAKVFKSTNSDRTIRLSVDMSRADVSYLCSLSMRAWEKRTTDQRNSVGNYAYGYSYGYSGRRDSEDERQTFVLSHIENLEDAAANAPELYEIAKSVARRYFNGKPGDYTYDAERARAQKDCETDVKRSIDALASRYKNEDAQRYKLRSVK